MNPLAARAHGKRVAEWLADPHRSEVESCSSCLFNIYRPGAVSSNGVLTCTLTGTQGRRRMEMLARKTDCPIPSVGGDESWRSGLSWKPIREGVTLCPTCLCGVGLKDGAHMNPCPYCGQGNLRLAPRA